MGASAPPIYLDGIGGACFIGSGGGACGSGVACIFLNLSDIVSFDSLCLRTISCGGASTVAVLPLICW